MPVDWLQIEIVYASAERQQCVALTVPAGSTLRGAIERAQLADTFDIAPAPDWSYGIFGSARASDTLLNDGDRIEIYRPLVDDPKLVRRRRAAARAARR